MSKELLAHIGLEVHVQLKTSSKMFCSCSTDFGAPANTNICPVCTGQPGALPVKNKKAIELAVRAALVLNCEVQEYSLFARKNYFYPDLPKAYQISQYELPISKEGFVVVGEKKIRIVRAHLEEDAGKLLHFIGSIAVDGSLVDLNRCGIPLLEIVSYPDIDSPETAFDYLKTLKRLLRYADVSDCDMEKGSLRCDCNVSVSYEGEPLGVKTEIKNMNSFKEIKDAISYEIERQKKVQSSGGKIFQETRLWDAKKGVTIPMRSKEEAHDYRYFPDPDLRPVFITQDEIFKQKKFIPQLPDERKKKYLDLGLSEYQADVLIEEKDLADYFEKVAERCDPKESANIIITHLLRHLNEKNISFSQIPLHPDHIVSLVRLKTSGKISAQTVKRIFPKMFEKNVPPENLLKDLDIVSDESSLQTVVESAIEANKKAWEEYVSGKEKAIGRIIGFVMNETKGSADPVKVKEILEKKRGRTSFSDEKHGKNFDC